MLSNGAGYRSRVCREYKLVKNSKLKCRYKLLIDNDKHFIYLSIEIF